MSLRSFLLIQSRHVLAFSIGFFLVSLIRHHYIPPTTISFFHHHHHHHHGQSSSKQKQEQFWQQRYGQPIADLAPRSSLAPSSMPTDSHHHFSTINITNNNNNNNNNKSYRNQEPCRVYTGLYSHYHRHRDRDENGDGYGGKSTSTDALAERLRYMISSAEGAAMTTTATSEQHSFYGNEIDNYHGTDHDNYHGTDHDNYHDHRSTAIQKSPLFEFIPMNIDEQLKFLKEYGKICFPASSSSDGSNNGSIGSNDNNSDLLVETYQKLILEEHTKPIAQELWKFCAMSYELEKHEEQQEESGGANADGTTDNISTVAYIDIDSPLLDALENIVFDLQRHLQTETEKGKITKNYAVLAEPLSPSNTIRTIHGSFFIFQSNNRLKNIPRQMVQDIIYSINNGDGGDGGSGAEIFYANNPLYISQKLYDLISTSRDEYNDEWIFLKQRCHSNPFHNHVLQQKRRRRRTNVNNSTSINTRTDRNNVLQPNNTIINNISCPSSREYCCDIIAPNSGRTIMVTKHVMLPYQLIPLPTVQQRQEHAVKTNNESASLLESTIQYDLPYIVSIEEEVTNARSKKTNNFFHFVADKRCLPTSPTCKVCMSKTIFNAGTCKGCAKYCSCFCDMLCHTDVEEKVVSKILRYSGMPLYRKDPTRMIPRIIHQTWFEEVAQESYPNFSRLTESWKQQYGWEYRFYNNDDAGSFLSAHFPPEVREAYDDLIPGAFKADLFRYCVLFIHGGVYADIDVHLTSKLDVAIDGDIGFMIPLDRIPGSKSVEPHLMCLWNGFMAAAPGHPILAKVIETVVNNVRNRFTSVDIMNTLCPGVDLAISTMYDILFPSGPCILGATVNKIFGKHPQTAFHVGDLDTSLSRDLNIPGRVVILDGKKEDMGAFRFSFTEKNLILAATDMPDFDDKSTDRKEHHYSKTRKAGALYGLSGLYRNNVVANEKIRFELIL